MEKKDSIFWILIGLALCMFALSTHKYFEVGEQGVMIEKTIQKELGERCEQCRMYNTSIGTVGLYFPKQKFYCVWAHNRTQDEIQRTEWHEYCHYLVDTDYEHFCE
jgi:hypothetical protein